jgi:hypothetical protein
MRRRSGSWRGFEGGRRKLANLPRIPNVIIAPFQGARPAAWGRRLVAPQIAVESPSLRNAVSRAPLVAELGGSRSGSNSRLIYCALSFEY